MKKLLLLSLLGILSACASDYKKRTTQYTVIANTNDSNIKLKLLEKQALIDCKEHIDYFHCAKAIASMAAIDTIWSRNYVQAIKLSELTLAYHEKYWNKYYYTDDPRKKFDFDCSQSWSFESGFSDSERKDLPGSFQMIYYMALKGAKDPRTTDYLHQAYLCELSGSFGGNKDQILKNYMQESIQLQDATNQIYVKRFINEIYKPIQQSEIKFYKKAEDSFAKRMVLYENALIYARKIGLPQIYQDYLNYNIYLYSRVY